MCAIAPEIDLGLLALYNCTDGIGAMFCVLCRC